ncbi:MAG TPA: carboxypeptidase-like regulatory domain-containing protein [Chitinophagaceae bacterium]|nr:carboxypeptidase-like regulatory domain-containing protein [Chitinophagaceae bacterium]
MSPNKLVLVLLLLLSLSFTDARAGDAKKTVNSGEFNINGTVVDGKTKKPLEGVTISAISSKLQTEKEINTNNQGNFKFESMPIFDLVITFEKKGYKTIKKEVSKLKEGELAKLIIELLPRTDDDEEDGMESPLRPIIGTFFVA